jgi:hypothetical protein
LWHIRINYVENGDWVGDLRRVLMIWVLVHVSSFRVSGSGLRVEG